MSNPKRPRHSHKVLPPSRQTDLAGETLAQVEQLREALTSGPQGSFLTPSDQLEELATALEDAQRLYGSPKAFTRLALENPREALRCAQAAKKLTGALREIQALA